ncbi:DNA-binding transcriptional LysR family regulator [Thermocatellispora tengchongensis]|uniref:DNA-binding transcriptional LysR family regulator n=1 Tax=Thermocatellispora tengchongensis TaxID=1073253 RepID=A0A840PHL9_9ACTN|nr:LysR family transcriptional regulator [Thermocatellispora tengchongensis]MBB5137311.1 DNA-binding transcriptional LysR family regulator [Thermocatellispora tengchongensis]
MAHDLNLLETLAVLLEERHISRAAERMHLSQPAMSRTLQRLRAMFGDELLVRAPQGYTLTPRARSIQHELADILPRLDALLRGGSFDPAAATDSFRIALTDYATTLLGPGIFQPLFHQAPGVSLTAKPLDEQTFADLDSGRLDLAILGVQPPKQLRWEVLFEEDLVCVVSADHPVTGYRMSLADFLSFPHVVVVIFGEEQTVVEQRLAQLGHRRPSGLRVPYFSAAVTALPGTSLVATLPRRLAERYDADAGLRLLEMPAEFSPFLYGMAWHPRVDGDPAHGWLREIARQAGRALSRA